MTEEIEQNELEDIQEPTAEDLEARQELEEQARKYGWRPKEDFTKDPEGWVDADRFLELPSTNVKMQRDINRELTKKLSDLETTSKQQFEGMERAHKAALDMVRQKAEDDYKAKMDEIAQQQRAAVETADTEAFDRLEKQKSSIRPPEQQDAPQVHQSVEQYRAANEWAQDPALWNEAIMAVEFNKDIQRRSPEEQIKYAESVMQRKYPHMFAAPEPAQPQRQRVDGGGLGTGARRGKGVNDLPADVLKVAKELVAEGVFKTEEAYAKAYFSQE